LQIYGGIGFNCKKNVRRLTAIRLILQHTIFMKQILTVFLSAISLYACNNATQEQPVTQQQMPVQEKEMKDAIAAYPDSILLKETLIQYYQDNGNLDMALAEINNAIKKDSINPRFLDKKAELYLLKDDTANALHAYEKAIEIFPDPQYIMSAGWLYAQTKNPNALAMADALLIGKNARADKEANLIKGLYYSYTGNKEKAIVFFDNCLALNYTFMKAYREKGIVLYEMGKYEEAIKVLDRAVKLQNDFADGYYWMGKCFEKLKNINAAVENYKTTLLYNADYIDAKDALGKLGGK
jgi:tetratricopeptide (TPR) repeat protein